MKKSTNLPKKSITLIFRCLLKDLWKDLTLLLSGSSSLVKCLLTTLNSLKDTAKIESNLIFFLEESGEEPTWNFWKYIVSVEGEVVGAYPPTDSVDDVMNEVRLEMRKMTNIDGAIHNMKKAVEISNEKHKTKLKLMELWTPQNNTGLLIVKFTV